MKEYLKLLPQEIQKLIRIAGDIAYKNGMSAYLVGGFVRDLILDEKKLDLDIVVGGNGIKFAEVFADRLRGTLTRHKRFNTATLKLDTLKIDIATARKESYPFPGSLPEVCRGTLKDDLFRRDFSINAMAISIMPEDFGRLIDFFGGKEDLGKKKIRILHGLSFIDDPTRILRAIRFEQRYDFKLQKDTLSLLKDAVRQRMLEKVHPHRLRDELILILKEQYPLKQLKRIQELTGFGFINQALSLSRKNYGFFKVVKTQLSWFKKQYTQPKPPENWLVYLAVLFDSLTINEIKSTCKKFAFRKIEEKTILTYKIFSNKISRQLSKNRISHFEIFKLLKPLNYEIIILLKAKYKNRNLQKNIKVFLESYDGIRASISGDDLKKLGLAPGPRYREILSRILEAKLDGRIKTKREELALVKRLILE